MARKRKPEEILELARNRSLVEMPEAEADLEQARLEAERAALEAARKRVDEMYREVSALWSEGSYREAIPKYHQVIAEAENVGYREALIAALKRIARCYYHLGHFEVAHGYMERAAGISVLDRAEENFFDSIKRKLWDREGKRRRMEGF